MPTSTACLLRPTSRRGLTSSAQCLVLLVREGDSVEFSDFRAPFRLHAVKSYIRRVFSCVPALQGVRFDALSCRIFGPLGFLGLNGGIFTQLSSFNGIKRVEWRWSLPVTERGVFDFASKAQFSIKLMVSLIVRFVESWKFLPQNVNNPEMDCEFVNNSVAAPGEKVWRKPSKLLVWSDFEVGNRGLKWAAKQTTLGALLKNRKWAVKGPFLAIKLKKDGN